MTAEADRLRGDVRYFSRLRFSTADQPTREALTEVIRAAEERLEQIANEEGRCPDRRS